MSERFVCQNVTKKFVKKVYCLPVYWGEVSDFDTSLTVKKEKAPRLSASDFIDTYCGIECTTDHKRGTHVQSDPQGHVAPYVDHVPPRL